ncbi:hypothetical protein [Raoultella ornithinolytica]|uniref:hypothetical protein n=1 Tax=Raoultella ornithinolytica TaxID=54291 RepID=UPI001F1F8D32|nr:hypothetical protein [Raoultella ornithinolytica]
MTKSTITREESIQAVFDLKVGYTLGLADIEILKRVARMALAAMDSEPVAIIDQANLDYLRSGADADVWPPEREEMGDVLLYRHAQPVPAVPTFDEWMELSGNNPLGWVKDAMRKSYDACRAAMLQAGNSPVIPDGWTGNDKANAALMMLDRIETVDPVDDDRIDGIKHIIHELAATPQEVK